MSLRLATALRSLATACALGSIADARVVFAQTMPTTTFVVGVADAESGQPVAGAEVILFASRRVAKANDLGQASLAGVSRGTQRVRVRRLGYAPLETDVAMIGDTTGAVFRLRRSPTEIAPVAVNEEWMPPKMKDVVVRRKQGIGRFLGETELVKDAGRDFQGAMTTRFPGLKLVIDSTNTLVLASTRDHLGVKGIGPCVTAVYLDDILLNSQDRQLVQTWDLAAVEYYTGAEVPVRYRTGSYGCGVLLLWSKWH
jgi:hypothetical protein